MIQTCLDDCTKVASPYKEFNLLVVANMSEQKTPLDLWGATETIFHSSEKWKILTIDAWENFDNTGKKYFSYLKEQSQK